MVAFIECDVRDSSFVKIAADFMPGVVIHLAAQPRVRDSITDPLTDAWSNVVGSVNVITASIRADVRRIIMASSGGAVYGERRRGHRITEDERCTPVSPYGLSKASADAYLAQLAPHRGVSLAVGNVFGPEGDGAIAAFLEAVTRGDRPHIFGDGRQTRDFVHVDDVSRAIVLACRASHVGKVNIGSGKATTINQIVAMVSTVTGVAAKPIFLPAVAGEVRHNRLDISRAWSRLGWRPSVGLLEGIRELAVPALPARLEQPVDNGAR